MDALSLSWENLDPYAFPPAAIVGKVVEKLQDYPCNRIILITPGCPNMPWFWDLVAMSSQDRKLHPGTIDGYRSAIAGKLCNSTINVSKDENLSRLLDSFHRDRPKGRRGIPSWNLSLVLHQLTKASFEP